MAEIGKMNELEVVKLVDFGLYLNGGGYGEILLPRRYVPEGVNPGDYLNVFVYLDSEDRIIATTDLPYAMLDEFAFLKVVSVNSVGAFLDWGLAKDLLVPFREQKQNMEEGRWYLVFIYLDPDTKRIVASAKLDKFLDNVMPEYTFGQEVDLLISGQTDIGYSAIINNTHTGILYDNEVFQPLRKGQKVKGYIKKIREDEKIDLSLQKPGYGKVDGIAGEILSKLKENNGFLAVSDKTEPEVIYRLLGISKKSFKMSIGMLYKQKLISIHEDGIYLL